MKKTILISLGFLFLISALMAVTIWRAPNLPASKSLQDVLPKEFRETFPTMKTSEPKKFISPDGKFQIEYPGDWVTTNQEELLGSLAPQEWAEKYNLQTMLLAQDFWGGKSTQLIVYKGTFEIPIVEILKKMEEVNKNNGWTVEILESKIEINEGILDLKYKNPAGSFVLSKEKILLDGRDGYLISLFAPEKYWQGLAGDIDKIVNSVTVKE